MFLRELHLVLSLFVTGQMCQNQEAHAGIYTEIDFKGENDFLNVTDCVSLLATKFHKTIKSIDTLGTCVHMYKGPNCTGDYLLTKPGTPVHNRLHIWTLPSGESAFSGQIESIGPCTDLCERSTPSRPSTLNSIQVYFNEHDATLGEDNAFSGESETFEVNGCIPMTTAFNPYSTPIKFAWDGLCIEFYNLNNCTDPFPIQRTGSGHRLNPVGRGNNDTVKSISRCGYNCAPGYLDNFHDTPSNYSTIFLSLGILLLLLLAVAIVTVLYRRRMFMFHSGDEPQAFQLL